MSIKKTQALIRGFWNNVTIGETYEEVKIYRVSDFCYFEAG
jgi:hypothetical protein